MLLGYMRVSKADGSQPVDLQRDALTLAGIASAQITRTAPQGGSMPVQASRRC